jgi:hypothetical protein
LKACILFLTVRLLVALLEVEDSCFQQNVGQIS